ncbi:flagellar basal body-associated FliL family protein [Reinekea marinisedimentorum]|uniref:Flagellar protein FliL n=1 Tax=Reinekea marinisedimentorum TaxID=230495 RepID=A0A4R3IDB0_9GAMM|nr:flagellar basal body-associated FliL family protein [Reinekea marinisedimentorum]TCS43824.1 flagellar FliL protein [Reinekea marinisedimentorum]
MSFRVIRNFKFLIIALIATCAGSVFSADDDSAIVPGYVELDPSFTLNYGDIRRTRYIQTTMTLRLSDSSTELDVKAHNDAIRHTIIMQFSEQSAETLKSTEKRDEFLSQLTAALQELMVQETGEPLIERVLLTTFIMQP